MWEKASVRLQQPVQQCGLKYIIWYKVKERLIHEHVDCWINRQWHSSFCVPLQKCDEIIVLHLGFLNYTQYQVMVSFKGLENITYEIKVKFVVSGKNWGFVLQHICLVVVVWQHFDMFLSLRFLLKLPPQWKTYNPTFSQVEIWFRFVFVVLTFMVTVRTRLLFRSNS